MKNLLYLIVASLMFCACEDLDPMLEIEGEKQASFYESNEKLTASAEETQGISVMATDRELYEYSAKATGLYNKELEHIFSSHLKEFGEEFPGDMQLSIVDDPERMIKIPRPVPCICQPSIVPEDYIGYVKVEDIAFKVFAYSPSDVSIVITNEKGEVMYRSVFDYSVSKPELNTSASFKLKKVGEIRGEEFLLSVNTNYLVKDKITKKSLKYSVSDKML